MITRVLVANRCEIARRVFATCRRLGIGTVAVYTDPDADLPHVAEADARVRLQGRNGYLDIAQIIAAAQASGADAIHPGYGFLSENPDFAAAVIDAGLTWIGPPVAAVSAMGSKIEAKKLMAAAGVPVLTELDPDTVTAEQLPVLVKASAGGGGRGMRVVGDLAALPDEVAAAQREAQSAFGDPTVFCEHYLAAGHHVEVQVLADAHGTVWTVGERECSIQRRHQKVIEEAPSPLVERTPGMRAKLFDAARLAAQAIGYTGAGTVEFMADDNGDFFFLEMNTRLQVEHPVTEATTGLDLVELQLLVADGGRLDPEPPPTRGAAIEARIYAEDPAKDWQPQAGTLHRFDFPENVRTDTGFVDGSVVSVFYDSMLAKVIAHAPTRRRAAAVLADALARARIHGVRTNRDLLVNVLRHPAFLDGATDTAFFDTHGLDVLAAPLTTPVAARARRSPPRWPMPPTTAAPQRLSCPHPAAGATWPRVISSVATTMPLVRRSRCGTGSRATACGYPTTRTSRWSRRRRPAWCWVSTGSSTRSTWPATATTSSMSSSTHRWARCGSPRCPASPIPGTPSRTVRCWPPCPAPWSVSAPRSARRCPRANLWCGWRP